MSLERISIGKFSLITRLSQKALRLYDTIGLLKPAEKDLATGYRYYTISQIEKAIKIKTLTWMGFNLDEIKLLLNADKKETEKIFQKRLSEIQKEIERLKKIESILLNKPVLEDVFDAVFNISISKPVIKEVPKLRVLSKREKGTYEKTIGKLIGELMNCINHPDNQRNLVKISAPIMMLCYDEEYKENDADIEVAIPISGRITVEDPFMEVKTLPECEVVSVIYKGPYENIGVAYSKIYSYAAENNLKLIGPDRSLYLNNPNEVKEDDLMTEIQYPVKVKTE